jgi:cell fate regulator YaaT (PSP1 superfamily)
MQKATLDPSKISGYCGRLKCCLRYEDKTYIELKRSLPKKNTVVKTKHGQGRVIDTQILTQLVMIEHDDGTKIAVPVEELEEISSSAVKKEEQDDTQNDEIRDDRESEKQ